MTEFDENHQKAVFTIDFNCSSDKRGRRKMGKLALQLEEYKSLNAGSEYIAILNLCLLSKHSQ